MKIIDGQAVEYARWCIQSDNDKAPKYVKDNGRKLINRGGNEISEDIEEHAEELRYNPYHDPTNGRFTSGSSGAYLHVPMGAKGKGEYIVSTDNYHFRDANNKMNFAAKERGVKNYKENQVFHIAKPDGTFKEQNGDTFEFGGREFGIHEIYGFTAGNFAVTDTKTGLSLGWYHTPKEAVSGIRKNINTVKSFKNLNAAESALDAYLYTKESKRAEKLRFNPNHDLKNGKFTSGGGNSSKGLTGGGNGGKMKMSKKEYLRVSHEIATNFPTLKADGIVRTFDNRNHRYQFEVVEFGKYAFYSKKKIK